MLRSKLARFILRMRNGFSPHNECNYTKKLMSRSEWHKKVHSHITRYPHIFLLAASLGYISYNWFDVKYVYADAKKTKCKTKIYDKTLPTYTKSEVAKHITPEERIWCTFKHGVYDITDFIVRHPGGDDQIMMGAGGALDPFWKYYTTHDSQHVLDTLEKYRIGNLDPKETIETLDMPDPFAKEPKRHPLMKTYYQRPYNGAAPINLLIENFITPNEFHYVRNHNPVPDINPDAYRLEVEIEGKKETLTLTLDELKKFPKHTVTTALQCAGNRKSESAKVKPFLGLIWESAAMSNATWSGARLCDVLQKAGLTDEDIGKHTEIKFEAYDVDAAGVCYGASIPIWRGVESKCEAILAYEMNGVPLPPDHGYPVRALIPGLVGFKNVKWLEKIIVCSEESESFWHAKEYRGFPPSSDFDNPQYDKSYSISEMPVTSVIGQPLDKSTVKVENGHITAKGYAWSGGGLDIIRVDVTTDCGKTWHIANFDHHEDKLPPRHFSWTLWSCKLPVSKDDKQLEIWVKAVDSSFQQQPESFVFIWNFRGILNNAWNKIKVNLEH